MKKNLLLLFVLSFFSISNAQVNSVQVNPGGTFYSSITTAFASIFAAAPISQAYTIEIQSIYDGSLEIFPISLTAVTGASSSNTITIRPASGVLSVMIASTQAGFGIIDINTADYITIDGRAGGTGSSRNLTIRNSSNSNTIGTSAIRLTNDAENNVIKYCILQAVGKDANSGTGVVQFTTTNGTNGNSGNLVTRNLIQDDPTNLTDLPTYCVASNGNTSSGSGLNSNNRITNNELSNFFNRGVSLFGLNGNGWNIDSNFVYRNTTKTIAPTNCLSILTAITGWTINNNTISGITPTDSFYLPTNFPFTGIIANNGGTGVIQNNTITKVRMNSTIAGTCINVGGSGGNFIISGNMISDITQRSSGESRGIVSSASTVVITNNLVTSFECTGGTETNNNVRGIFHSGIVSTATIADNIVTNLYTSGSSTTFNATNVNPLNGIFVGTADSAAIYNNTVTNLNLMNSGAINVSAFGIGATNCLRSYIGNNFVANINNAATGAASSSGGIIIYAAASRHWVLNNWVSIGYNTNSALSLFGILHFNTAAQTGPLHISDNSVQISGTSSGTANSYAFQRVRETPIELKGNILANTRSGGTGSHYSVSVINSTSNWTPASIDNNDLYAANSTTIGQWLATAYDFGNWRINSGGDAASISLAPLFHSVTNLRLLPNSPCYNAGTPVSYVLTDRFGFTRSLTTPTIGAVEMLSSQSPTSQNTIVSPTTGVYNEVLSLANPGGVSIRPTTISPATGVNVTAQYYSSGRTGTPSGVLNMSSYYWTVACDAANFNGSVRFYFDNISGSGVLVPSTLKLMHRDGPDISTWGEWPFITNGSNYIEATNVSSFSEFALGGNIDNPLPVELTNFSATIINRDVNLNWTTTTEINNSGFEIERKTGENNWLKIGFVAGRGNSNHENSYTFADRNLVKGIYNYRLKQIDYNGGFQYYNLNGRVNIGVPIKFELSQNYPNPFNPTTKINFSLPKDAKVTLTVFDISGREIARLLNNEFRQADFYTVQFNGLNLASGVYFYRIETGDFIESKKMMLIK